MPEILHWSAGSTAQADLFKDPADPKTFLLKYRSPFRSMIRPTYPCWAAASTLDRANRRLDTAINILLGSGSVPRSTLSGTSALTGVPNGIAAIDSYLSAAGRELADFILEEPEVRNDLKQPGMFVELGTDDQLVGYPWELIHDGEQFLCLKHCMARHINVTPQRLKISDSVEMLQFPQIKLLLISVPAPAYRSDIYPPLEWVYKETQRLVTLVAPLLPQVEIHLLAGTDATFDKVRQEIRRDTFQIIHFCGHANFDSNVPSNSSIILHDEELSTRTIMSLVNRASRSVVLSFVNACQTAAVNPVAPIRNEWEARFNTLGLATAFIGAGSYFLGSRWRLSDDAAAEFAIAFYDALLRERKPIGQAVKEARHKCKAFAPNDVAWASYVYFGDPRIGFQHV